NEACSGRISPYDFCYFVLTDERSRIYERIDIRVDMMVDSGLEGEVRMLLGRGLTKDNVSMHGIGYKEMIEYIEGRCTLDEAVYKIKLNTRHFAKRQLTWFRREKDVTFIDINDERGPVGAMMEHLKAKGITDGR
ncbi:MAG: tRNA (adenosine(37)-N6)-dimethylallyltransferase MiaA, partial [Lachnospiraceae bacterium]|nr:tRNA (adenosine(37)-N6)-dimethylallyltransferase MiaA [Lachnospiraceae bacterium]